MDEQKPLAIVCDLDGTLCINDQGRSPYDYLAARHDAVNPAVHQIIHAFLDNSYYGCEVIFVSAREEHGRETAVEWMNHHTHGLIKFFDCELFMRADGDHRQDCIVKEEIYREHIEPYYDVLFVLDDRDQVVNMWRRTLGLTCFQVTEGRF